MNDQYKTNAELIAEVEALRQRVAMLETHSQAEENTQTGESHYRQLFEHSMDGVLLTQPTGEILYANPATCTLLGYTEAELQAGGRNLVVYLDDPRLQKLLEERRQHGRVNGELTLVRQDGTHFEAEISSAVFTSPDGQSQTSMFIRDVTERKQMEEALFRNETELRTLIELLPVGVSVLNSDHQIVEVNASLEQILSIDRVGLLQGAYTKRRYLRADGKTMPPEEFASTRARHEQRPVYNVETGVVKEDGEIIWTEVSAAPLPDGRIVIVTTDITDRKRAEAERKAQEIQMVEDQRLKSLGLLAGGVAHDINNLLTPIGLNIEILRMAHVSTPKSRKLLQSIENAAQKIGNIVQQMLAYAGHGEPALGAMDMNKLVEGIYTLLHASLPKNVDLQLDLTADSLPMQGDRIQMEQMLMNLIMNASEAYEGQVGEVVVSTRRQSENEVALTVWDNGPGISEENQSRIFDPFFSTKKAGRGLGLSAAQGIITVHGGEISVDSRIGEGTMFTIRLPLAWPVSNSDQSGPDADALPALKGMWLIIDDEDIVRQAACEALEFLGFQFIEAPNGKIGLEMVEKNAAELAGVLLDLTMPGMSGREVFEQLRRAYPDLPVVIASGYSEQAVQDLLNQPDVAFISKPFNIYDLETTIRSLMG